MDELSRKRTVSAADYVVFGSMLGISAIIGIFYAIKDRKLKHGTEGYLLAGRSMSVIPVAISLTVSFQSSITMLAIPADVYHFGIMFIWGIIGLWIACIVVANVFLPTFHRLGVSSMFEYLERRFSRSVRLVCTSAFLLQNFMYLGVNTYGPALALSEVTGFDLTAAMLTTGIVCAFYTTLGGLKAVIWTDVFQGLVMAAGMIIFIIRGSMLLGGMGNVWNIAEHGGRTRLPTFDTDPRVRYSFWSILVGGFTLWLGVFGSNQSQIQRYLCIKSEKRAKMALYLSGFGIAFFSALATLCGLILYAYYSGCDPLSQKCVHASDQLIPYMVMDIFRNFNGLPGMFLASVFSSSLSTVSSGLNAMVTVSVEDFVKPHTDWTERTYTLLSKGIAVVYGGIVLGVAFLVSVMGDMLTVAMGCVGSYTGAVLGLFILGIWFPFTNTLGALCGLLGGLGMSSWVFFGSRGISKSNAFLQKMEMRTDQCITTCGYMDYENMTGIFNHLIRPPNSTTEVITFPPPPDLGPLENIYSLSYFYVTPIGLVTTLFVGIVVSLLTCGWKQRATVDRKLTRCPLGGWACPWLSASFRKYLRCGDHRREQKIDNRHESEALKELEDDAI